MPIASNLLTSVILAPVVTVLSALSLATVQRAMDWISSIAKTPQKGTLRQIKPFIKNVNMVMERIFKDNKFEPTATNILLTAIIILLLCSLLEGAEKPKKVVVVDKKRND